MNAITIGLNNVRRLVRDRSNIFFVFIFPMLLILVIGASFGSSFTIRLGVMAGSGELAAELVEQLAAPEDMTVEQFDDRDRMSEAVARGRLEAAVVVPADYDESLLSGGQAQVEYIAGPGQLAQQLRATVGSAVAQQGAALRAARVVSDATGQAFVEAYQTATETASALPGVAVAVETAGEPLFDNVGQFDVGAAQNLTLFVFLTSLAGSAALIQTRRWGVSHRMLSTPNSSGVIITGESLGRYAVALTQGLFIVLGSLVAFGVNWGGPLTATVILLVFCATGAGAGMLLGSALDNDEQAGSLGVFLGLGIAALGGAMVPVEIFPDTMKTVAMVTPHYWAIDAFAETVRRGGGLSDIGPQLGVLAIYAAALLAIATVLFRRKLTR